MQCTLSNSANTFWRFLWPRLKNNYTDGTSVLKCKYSPVTCLHKHKKISSIEVPSVQRVRRKLKKIKIMGFYQQFGLRTNILCIFKSTEYISLTMAVFSRITEQKYLTLKSSVSADRFVHIHLISIIFKQNDSIL